MPPIKKNPHNRTKSYQDSSPTYKKTSSQPSSSSSHPPPKTPRPTPRESTSQQSAGVIPNPLEQIHIAHRRSQPELHPSAFRFRAENYARKDAEFKTPPDGIPINIPDNNAILDLTQRRLSDLCTDDDCSTSSQSCYPCRTRLNVMSAVLKEIMMPEKRPLPGEPGSNQFGANAPEGKHPSQRCDSPREWEHFEDDLPHGYFDHIGNRCTKKEYTSIMKLPPFYYPAKCAVDGVAPRVIPKKAKKLNKILSVSSKDRRRFFLYRKYLKLRSKNKQPPTNIEAYDPADPHYRTEPHYRTDESTQQPSSESQWHQHEHNYSNQPNRRTAQYVDDHQVYHETNDYDDVSLHDVSSESAATNSGQKKRKSRKPKAPQPPVPSALPHPTPATPSTVPKDKPSANSRRGKSPSQKTKNAPAHSGTKRGPSEQVLPETSGAKRSSKRRNTNPEAAVPSDPMETSTRNAVFGLLSLQIPHVLKGPRPSDEAISDRKHYIMNILQQFPDGHIPSDLNLDFPNFLRESTSILALEELIREKQSIHDFLLRIHRAEDDEVKILSFKKPEVPLRKSSRPSSLPVEPTDQREPSPGFPPPKLSDQASTKPSDPRIKYTQTPKKSSAQKLTDKIRKANLSVNIPDEKLLDETNKVLDSFQSSPFSFLQPDLVNPGPSHAVTQEQGTPAKKTSPPSNEEKRADAHEKSTCISTPNGSPTAVPSLNASPLSPINKPENASAPAPPLNDDVLHTPPEDGYHSTSSATGSSTSSNPSNSPGSSHSSSSTGSSVPGLVTDDSTQSEDVMIHGTDPMLTQVAHSSDESSVHINGPADQDESSILDPTGTTVDPNSSSSPPHLGNETAPSQGLSPPAPQDDVLGYDHLDAAYNSVMNDMDRLSGIADDTAQPSIMNQEDANVDIS